MSPSDHNTSTPHRGPTPWTMRELKKASVLWSDGLTIAQIAQTIGRTHESVKFQTYTRRDLFPRRKNPRLTYGVHGAPVNLKFDVTPYLHKAIRAEARAKGVSMSKLVRDILTDTLLRKKLWGSARVEREPQPAYMGEPGEAPKGPGER